MAQINIANSGTSGIETPQSGVVAIFSNSADSGKLYYKFSDGTISPVDTGGTSGGDSGTSGTSGAAGDSGTSGTSGEAGTSGTTGDSGTSGTSGTGSGDSGTSGTSGEAGTSGTSGTGSGDSGTSGTSGEAGTSGTSGTGSGDSGTSGTTGADGTSGTNGADGTSGTTGADGTSGTNGEDGTSGTSGASGGAGTSGTDGDSGTSGTQGLSGTSGTQGLSGTSGTTGDSGTAGTSGTSGDEGTSGTSGDGTSGTSGEGTSGTSGNDGTSGTGGAGTSGTSGADGTSGTGVTGTSGTSGEGTSGTSGAAGAAGTSGTSGAGGGGGGISTVFNNTVRYRLDDTNTTGTNPLTSTRTAEFLCTGTLYGGLSWSRSSTTISITSTAHGLTAGDYVVVRNMGDTDYLCGIISNVSTNAFDITNAVNSGDTSGTEGAYIPVAYIDTSVTTNTVEMTVKSPSAGDIQIASLKLTLPSKSGTTFTLKMPQSISNGAGGNTSVVSENPPIVASFNTATGQYVSAASSVSIYGSVSNITNYNYFQVGGYTSLQNFLTKFTF